MLVVVFYWTPESSRVLHFLSIPLWIAILLHLASVAGPMRVPLVVAVLILMAVGFVTEISKERKATKKQSGNVPLYHESCILFATHVYK